MKNRRRQPLPAEQPTPPERLVPTAAIMFGVALIVRLIHLWQIRRAPFFDVLMGDARGYDVWAERIAGGEWIGREVFYQAPLYPYFLGAIYALFGRDLLVVRVVQAVVGSASCVLVGLTAWRLFSRRAGLVAGLGMALYAPAIFFDGLIQKSVLDVFFVSLALWLLSGLVAADGRRADLFGPPAAGPKRPGLRTTPVGSGFSRTFLCLGLAMGGLSLTRENALVLVAVILVWIAFGSSVGADLGRPQGRSQLRPYGAAAIFLLGLAIVLVPVAARNYAVGGGFYLTTSQFGPNFYIGNRPGADGTYASLRPGRGTPEYERQDATDLAERAMGRRLTPAEVSTYWTDRALDFVTSQPGVWLKLVGRKVMLLWNADEMLDTESQQTHAEWSLPLRATAWFAHFGVLVPLAVIGVWATWLTGPERRRLAIYYALTIAYAASVVMFYVFARYRFPLVPLLFLFAAPGLLAAPSLLFFTGAGAPPPAPADADARPRLSSASGSHSRRRFFSFTGAGARPPARTDADASPRISPSSARHGRRRLALFITITAAALFTNWPLLSPQLMQAITENNLATALQEEGRLDEAIAHYQRAAEIRPDYAPAYSNMGVALRARGQLAEAVAAYERALAIQPDNPDTHYNLANALLDQNRPGEAAEHFRLAGRSAPASGNVPNNLGIALAAQGKLEEAAAAFRNALEIEPDSAKAHRNLGDTLSSLGRHPEALAHLRRAVALEPTNVSFHYDLGIVLLDVSQLPQAIEAFQAALKLDPAFAPAHNNLGVALGSQGRFEEAIAHFEQALTIRPDYPDAQRNLEMALRSREQTRRK